MESQYLFSMGEIEAPDFDELKNRTIEEDSDATVSVIPPPDIVAFTEQRSCADIYRMYDKKQIDINPDFQRGEVWSNKAQTLFIDSLIKQLPIPSMCISLDIKTQKRLVIDGLQRITSIIKFLDVDNDWRLSKTEDVDERLSGKKVSTIKQENGTLFEILENVTIPITVLRCNYDDESHMKYLFQIFHRLNSGGNKLYNQEIRNCIYQGNFNTLLKELARSDEWLQFANTTVERVDKARFNNEERILRFYAFYDNFSNYNGKLAVFLNNFMGAHKQMTDDTIEEYEQKLLLTVSIANKIKQTITSKNVAEAVLIGIAKNMERVQTKSDDEITKLYEDLMATPDFSDESLQEGLGATEKVKSRIIKAIEIFGV